MAYNRATLIPAVPPQFFTDAGLIASGHKLFIYAAGTTTKVTTYTNAAATAANTNPIVLDAAGRATVFCDPANGESLKYVLASPLTADPPAGGDIIWTRDNVGVAANSEANIDILGMAAVPLATDTVVALDAVTGKWTFADPAFASLSIDAPRLGVVVAGGVADSLIVVRIQGRTRSMPGIVAGNTYYLSASAGSVSATPPTGANHIVPFGYSDFFEDLVFPGHSLSRIGTRLALKSFGFGVGQGNAAGGADTELTSYPFPIAAGVLDQPGACLVVEGTLSVAANADAKTFKLQVESGTLVTCWGSSANVANHVIPFRFLIYYRTSTTGSITGVAWHGATHGGAPANYLVNSAVGAVNWAAGQSLRAFSSANTIDSVKLTDFTVYPIRSYQGATV